MKNVKDLEVKGLKVLVRCDFNVPFVDGKISDDNRIQAALPTIKELLAKGAKVILMSHLGKIDYKKTEEEIAKAKKKNNMAPVAERLGELLGQEVKFCPETRGEALKAAVDGLKEGEVLVVQNTRYEKGESKCNEELSKEWASLCDAFVMDAFGSAHRAHASTYGVPAELKKEGKQVAVGFLVEKEVVALKRAVEVKAEDRPYVAILGGFKVSDKIKVINSLVSKCDKVIIGGAMAYTFFKALGKGIGNSPCEEDQLDYAKKMYETGKVVLPVDVVIANDFANQPILESLMLITSQKVMKVWISVQRPVLFTRRSSTVLRPYSGTDQWVFSKRNNSKLVQKLFVKLALTSKITPLQLLVVVIPLPLVNNSVTRTISHTSPQVAVLP